MLSRNYAFTVCACAFLLLGAHASAQIQVQSPGSTSSVPVHLQASVSSCNGNSITGLSYSVDSSPFYTINPNGQINAYDYSILPGAHTIRFKAWTGGSSPCEETDVNTTVSDNISPTTATNLDDKPNNDPMTEFTSTPDLWFGVPDTGTGCCIYENGTVTTTYTTTSGPNIDGQSRLYYVESNAQGSDTPGERYSIVFGQNGENFTHFVYDTYLYLADPGNIFSIEMDTNQDDSSGNIYLFGLQCVAISPTSQWQYTLDSGGDTWVSSGINCNPQSWSANTWHHVQLYVSRSGETVTYNSVSIDGITTFINKGGNSYFVESPPWSAGVLLLNLQLDAINNGGKTTTITAYTDGFSMFYW